MVILAAAPSASGLEAATIGVTTTETGLVGVGVLVEPQVFNPDGMLPR